VLGALLVPVIAILCVRFKALAPLKWYPVIVNGIFFAAFTVSFIKGPVIIFRFALLMDKTVKGSPAGKLVERYCRKVTALWCCFFAANGGIAALTVSRPLMWAMYNGCISYILMGTLFLGEIMVRKTVQEHLPKEIPFSRFTPDSRPMDTILSYEGAFSDGKYKRWRDLFRDTAALRAVIASSPKSKWVLHSDDCWYFLTAFIALFQCKKQVLLTANVTPGYLADITGSGEDTGVLSDADIPGAVSIPGILNAAPEGEVTHVPFNPVESVFTIFTSGTTGKPKAIPHRIVEFEVNIGFPPEWVEAWGARKTAVTVDHHHIYGLVFSVILPFTLGVPFRRRRIDTPEEFRGLSDVPYFIITTPAFLKRATDSLTKLAMKEPWIIASGGFLPQDTAEKVNALFGFWPIDIYGSTEGSGIAYRQSKDGPEWTPFSSIKVSTNEAGCLVSHLPIPNVPPIPTGDLAEALPDGRFILKGRADSIVKIEEKRISLPEMEQRIMESGMAKDVCVVALEDRRQYLAAAIVLTDETKARFSGKDKLEINKAWTEHLAKFFEPTVIPKKWRYVDAIPQDIQGKKQLPAVKALFA
jgi:acyl-CoA synthetase (AMP-forming)/AMP-acid ligase II